MFAKAIAVALLIAGVSAPASAAPMTYMVNGKQYIVQAVGGRGYSGELIAFRLPSANPPRRRGGGGTPGFGDGPGGGAPGGPAPGGAPGRAPGGAAPGGDGG